MINFGEEEKKEGSDFTPEEIEKAKKTQNLLYLIMGIGVLLPLIAFIFLK
jgi:hypothetical protein